MEEQWCPDGVIKSQPTPGLASQWVLERCSFLGGFDLLARQLFDFMAWKVLPHKRLTICFPIDAFIETSFFRLWATPIEYLPASFLSPAADACSDHFCLIVWGWKITQKESNSSFCLEWVLSFSQTSAGIRTNFVRSGYYYLLERLRDISFPVEEAAEKDL